ncbi:MAG: extracellular solute-binding protein, partial [Oscillospiraceae bacterium]|nr:extracellular solute-binding protein [Oscillospiraceae bacterium]
GIIYDPNIVTGPVTSWDVLFDPQYSGQILMFDNPRDALGIALKLLGYSLNTTDETELNAAFEKLKEQKPLLQAYVMDQIFDKLESGEAALGPYYAGDYITMLDNNPDLEFCLPDEGTNLFIDAMCIPKGAKNKRNAEAFINFMCEPDTMLANCEEIGYSTPGKTSFDQLPEDVSGNEIQYPPKEVLDRCEVFYNLPDRTLEWYNDMWTELKS